MGTTSKETDFQWQAKLIAKRGRRMRFSDADLDDAIQEIVPHINSFHFDTARSNGASLRTALIAVIDRQLLTIRRRQASYARLLQRAKESLGLAARAKEAFDDQWHRKALMLDVQAAVGQLSKRDRQICDALSQGCSIQEVADQLGCDWHTVKRRIDRIREQFTQWGLDGWLEDA